MANTPGESPVPEVAADSDEPVAFSFQTQPEFHEVPLGLGLDEDALDEQMRSFARDYWGDREDWEPLRRMFAAIHAANAHELASQGVVYHALGIFPIGGTADGTTPPERISRCTLLVSTRDLENLNPAVSAAGIGEALTHSNSDGEVQLVRIPAGPAVINIGGSRAVWALPDEGEQERFLVRIELWVPFPAENRLLLFCLSTSDVEDLQRYQAILADIADTIFFGDIGQGQDTTAARADDITATFG